MNEKESHKQKYDNKNIANDDISIEGDLPDNTNMTINEINIVREINTAQMNFDPKTGEERDNEAIPSNHRYYLQLRLTRRNTQTCPSPSEQSTHYPQTTCTHYDDANEGIKKLRDKDSEALLRELNQLHERHVLLP